MSPCSALTQWHRISPPCGSVRARHVATKSACRPHCRCGTSPHLRLCFLYAPAGAKPERDSHEQSFRLHPHLCHDRRDRSEIGRAPVGTPSTNAHQYCLLRLEKKKKNRNTD